MRPVEVAAALVVLAAAFRYVNDKLLGMPAAVGVMALALGTSLLIALAAAAVPGVDSWVKAAVRSADMGQTLLNGMLGFILFAGAIKTDLRALASRKWTVTALATVGVLISTGVVGFLTWGTLGAIGFHARPIYCFIFGAVISPTDPVAVLAILRRAGVPKDVEVTISGESLFNDGVGIALFTGLLSAATWPHGFDPLRLVGLIAREALGGAAFGLAAGWLVYRLLRTVDNYQVELLLTVALVAGGFTLANALCVSGPIAMATAGLLIGNYARKHALSRGALNHIDPFWEMIDQTLNAILFVLIGLESLVLPLSGSHLLASALAIPLVLLARLVSVAVPTAVLRRALPRSCTVRLLTWGALRGGVSIALTLSIPAEVGEERIPERSLLIAMTYATVVFSILVQGLTIGTFARWWTREEERRPSGGSQPA
jgi:CPA1 family monovalent cation:H+ antiporter